ncbi:spermidine/putrescine ABC transporter substrate-binding protein [Piscirickettsiaceae bacterium NZ-RLO2]|uniref:extracellular solute-binding protein n=1 Tax=Piscirickettsia salmonis TaxID=1238 RepID=UPI000F095C02|nr:spermidine/putrescine ABC transporter substrate-binding protein [Piscirickettsiaceae bacterium NZ-RLO2]
MIRFFIILNIFPLLIFSKLDDKWINIFTWESYVTKYDLIMVNKLLNKQGYHYRVRLIKPWAEGPEQMFDIIRRKNVDISFLTLNYIKMQEKKLEKLIQPIEINSPRLKNYKFLNKNLIKLKMGMIKSKILYIPWGGGVYGIWANKNKIKDEDLPTSLVDLLDKRWHKKISLTRGQIQPNIALVMLMLKLPPFYLNDISSDRKKLLHESRHDGEIQSKLNKLYNQVKLFWSDTPKFDKSLLLVASYGPGVFSENAQGANWQLIKFKEGNTIWLDTINFHKKLSGAKLEAAEIFANYFISKAVQARITTELGMIPASTLVSNSSLLNHDSNFFWPPYSKQADNIMNWMSYIAMKNRKRDNSSEPPDYP